MQWNLVKFDYAIQLSSSRAGRRPGFRPVADRFKLSRHVEIARTWSQTGSQLVCDQLATCIAPDRPNSIMLSSSLAGREPACELDSVMEFGVKQLRLYEFLNASDMTEKPLCSPPHVMTSYIAAVRALDSIYET